MNDEKILLIRQIVDNFELRMNNYLIVIKKLIDQAKSLDDIEIINLQKAIIRLSKLQTLFIKNFDLSFLTQFIQVEKQDSFNQHDYDKINKYLNQCPQIPLELKQAYQDVQKQMKIQNNILQELEVDEKTNFVQSSKQFSFYGYQYKKKIQGRCIMIDQYNGKYNIFDGYFLDNSQIYGLLISEDEKGKISIFDIQEFNDNLQQLKQAQLDFRRLSSQIHCEKALQRIPLQNLSQEFLDNLHKLEQIDCFNFDFNTLAQKELNQYNGFVCTQTNQKHGFGVYFDIEREVIFAGLWDYNKPIRGLLVYETKLGEMHQYLNYIL